MTVSATGSTRPCDNCRHYICVKCQVTQRPRRTLPPYSTPPPQYKPRSDPLSHYISNPSDPRSLPLGARNSTPSHDGIRGSYSNVHIPSPAPPSGTDNNGRLPSLSSLHLKTDSGPDLNELPESLRFSVSTPRTIAQTLGTQHQPTQEFNVEAQPKDEKAGQPQFKEPNNRSKDLFLSGSGHYLTSSTGQPMTRDGDDLAGLPDSRSKDQPATTMTPSLSRPEGFGYSFDAYPPQELPPFRDRSTHNGAPSLLSASEQYSLEKYFQDDEQPQSRPFFHQGDGSRNR